MSFGDSRIFALVTVIYTPKDIRKRCFRKIPTSIVNIEFWLMDTIMEWIFVSPHNSYVTALNRKHGGFGGEDLGKKLGVSWGHGGPWDGVSAFKELQCSVSTNENIYQRRQLSASLEEDPPQELNLPATWPWIPQPPDCEKSMAVVPAPCLSCSLIAAWADKDMFGYLSEDSGEFQGQDFGGQCQAKLKINNFKIANLIRAFNRLFKKVNILVTQSCPTPLQPHRL